MRRPAQRTGLVVPNSISARAIGYHRRPPPANQPRLAMLPARLYTARSVLIFPGLSPALSATA
jgi:hypothetical protein